MLAHMVGQCNPASFCGIPRLPGQGVQKLDIRAVSGGSQVCILVHAFRVVAYGIPVLIEQSEAFCAEQPGRMIYRTVHDSHLATVVNRTAALANLCGCADQGKPY